MCVCAFSPSTVQESFKDYVTVEPLEGENKYDAGEYGLQVRPVRCFLSMVGSSVEGNKNLLYHLVSYFLATPWHLASLCD